MNNHEDELKNKLQFELEELKNENQEILKQFDKLDSRINALLAVNLGIFSLEVSFLTNTMKNIFENILEKQLIMVIFFSLLLFSIVIINIFKYIEFKKILKNVGKYIFKF